MKKILIASPTADLKDYCFDKWMENVSKFTYPNYKVLLCDNSTTRDYYIEIKKRYEHLGDLFNVARITPSQYNNNSYKHILAKSHDKCRLYAIENDFDYLLHLETDIFPPINVIERLLDANKKVVGAMYHIELGERSKLMIQQMENFGDELRETYNLDETDIEFVDGDVKKVFSCGLGCVLIHKSVLSEVGFRYEEGSPVHPDSFYFADLDAKRIPVYVDTSIYCEHENQTLVRV
jgi:GT2 family glycosyltransferase